MKKKIASAFLASAFALATLAPTAFAAAPFAGNSDNFKHQSNPCQGSGGKAAKCVGNENSYK